MARFRRHFERVLEPADVRLDGDRPWDPRIHDDRVFQRALTNGTLGLGEAYMDGWWDCEALDELVARIQASDVIRRLQSPRTLLHVAEARLRNLQSSSRAFEIGERHYDIGNGLYERMLDRRMIYSCAYWRDADDLDTAQQAKLDLVANKLELEPGLRVLDIGCGWGGAAQYFAEQYGCDVVGITVSREQAELARERVADLPVEIRVQDYRELDEPFDRVYSIGMFEHVGVRNYSTYFDVVRRCLRRATDLSLLHTIGGQRSKRTTDPWIERYIFPNSMIPSAAQITRAAEGRLTIEDWHNFGPDYDRTLLAWHRNVSAAWTDLGDAYDERFRRMWRFYLLTSAGTFRARRLHLWQIVMSRDGTATTYAPTGIR